MKFIEFTEKETSARADIAINLDYIKKIIACGKDSTEIIFIDVAETREVIIHNDSPILVYHSFREVMDKIHAAL